MVVRLIKDWAKPTNGRIIEAGREMTVTNEYGKELIEKGTAIQVIYLKSGQKKDVFPQKLEDSSFKPKAKKK